jgi:hypothetical protein
MRSIISYLFAMVFFSTVFAFAGGFEEDPGPDEVPEVEAPSETEEAQTEEAEVQNEADTDELLPLETVEESSAPECDSFIHVIWSDGCVKWSGGTVQWNTNN